MENEKEKDEQKEKKETEDKGKDAGDKEKREPAKKREDVGVIKSAKETAERIEKANAEHERLIAEEKELMAERALSGKAGISAPEKPETEDEKWKREAKKRYEGTGMDPTE